MNEQTVRTIKRPWNCPQDVPLNCWIRSKRNNASTKDEAMQIVGMSQNGVVMLGYWSVGPDTTQPIKGLRVSWSDLETQCLHSTDRIDWKPCTVEIPAPIEFHPIPEWLTRHNPDNLTPEQVGEGWRLLADEEQKIAASFDIVGANPDQNPFWRRCEGWKSGKWNSNLCCGYYSTITYRVPASTPYPERPKTQHELDEEWIDQALERALKNPPGEGRSKDALREAIAYARTK